MMKKKISIETITDLFIMPAFRTARHQHPEIQNEEELLPHVLELLRLANQKFKESVDAGNTEYDTLYDVIIMFKTLCPSSI